MVLASVAQAQQKTKMNWILLLNIKLMLSNILLHYNARKICCKSTLVNHKIFYMIFLQQNDLK